VSVKKIFLQIGEMSCVNCSNAVERTVKKIDGVKEANVSFSSGEGVFVYDDNKTSSQAIEAKIEKIGYKILRQNDKEENSKSILAKVILSAVLTLFLHFAHHLGLSHQNADIMVLIAATIVQFICGFGFYKHTFKALSNKTLDMNALVALGTSAAYFYSIAVFARPLLFPENMRFFYFDGAAMIITFVLFGRFLESRAKFKATNFINELLLLSPKKAALVNGKELKSEELKKGDIIEVKSGQNIALDGVVVYGEGEVDASIMNGEATLGFVKPGDSVLGGTILKVGYIHVRVEKEAQDTLLFEIVRLLKDASGKKMPIARLADKIASVFVPSVMLIALLTFIVWSVIGNMQMAILSFISTLIISCPCALGLAVPIAIVAGVGRGAKEGILIKNPEVLEIMSKVKFAVFDKTGTLTKGDIKVSKSSVNRKYLDIFASLEAKSEHPISYAIRDFAKSLGAKEDLKIENIRIKIGLGITGTYQNKIVAAGSHKLMQDLGIEFDKALKREYERDLEKGIATVFCAFENKIAGQFHLEDEIRDDAKAVVEYLNAKNIEPIMLTGDKKQSALFISQKIGIKNIIGEVLPQEKFEEIKKLQKRGSALFVGDGVNDSLSIKQADIGIAMNSGSDIAKKSGDIIIVNNKLIGVQKSVELSRATLRLVKQNLFWAFIYNIIGIPLAAGAFYPSLHLTPAIAGAAMSVSSVIVVLNSLRLKIVNLK
jgi:Cu+-exporting ATPase